MGVFDDILSALDFIWNSIIGLPGQIVEALNDLFIPDTDYIDTTFTSFVEDLKLKFNINTDFFTSIFNNSKPVEDVYMDYSIPGVGSFNLKVFDSKYLVQGVEFFRPFIRGFLVYLMLLFHVKQAQSFFGYDAGIVPGHVAAENDLKVKSGARKEKK